MSNFVDRIQAGEAPVSISFSKPVESLEGVCIIEAYFGNGDSEVEIVMPDAANELRVGLVKQNWEFMGFRHTETEDGELVSLSAFINPDVNPMNRVRKPIIGAEESASVSKTG